MKAAIPLKVTENASAQIADDFRSADTIRIYESCDRTFHDYSVANFHQGESLTDKLNEMKVYAVIAGDIKPLALRAFEDACITCYLPQTNDLLRNLEMFAAEKLLPVRGTIERSSSCSAAACASCASACKGEEDADN